MELPPRTPKIEFATGGTTTPDGHTVLMATSSRRKIRMSGRETGVENVGRAPTIDTPYANRARSYSQLSDYESCPQKFYLKRIDKVWTRPASWLQMGTAVHAAAESHGKQEITDYEGLLKKAQEVYRATINAELEKTPDASFWSASGPYKGPADIIRRYGLLGPHIQKYLREVSTSSHAVWTPPADYNEGTSGGGPAPAIEWRFSVDLDGIEVIGFADRIEIDGNGELEVVDVKTGSKHPTASDAAQLKVAALAAEDVTGVPVTRGRYLMTKDGLKSRQHDLTLISTQALTSRFKTMDDGVKAEDWTAKPSRSACERCEVLTSCEDGQKFLRAGG